MKLFYWVFLFTINISAQTVEIQYKYHEHIRPKDLPINETHQLINYENELSYYIVEVEQDNSHVPGYIGPEKTEILRTYKNFSQDSVYTVYPVSLSYHFVKERLPEIKWKLEEGSKNILDFECKKASTEYRGRKYEAYYTEKIPTTDGPWKFYGLPGTILEIYDSEKKLTIEAIGIKVIKNSTRQTNYWDNIKKKKVLTYDEHIKRKMKTYDRIKEIINSSLTNSSDVISTANLNKDYPQAIEIVDFEKYK